MLEHLIEKVIREYGVSTALPRPVYSKRDEAVLLLSTGCHRYGQQNRYRLRWFTVSSRNSALRLIAGNAPRLSLRMLLEEIEQRELKHTGDRAQGAS